MDPLTRLRRELNSLFVILRHLCVADLLTGFVTLSQTLLSVIEWRLLPDNTVLLRIIEIMSTPCNKYMMTVSAVLLNCLALLKMIIVTRNCWYTRSTVGKICKCVWLVTLAINSMVYGFSKSELISSESKVVLRRVWAPLCTSISFLFQCYCFGRIICRTRILNNRASRAARAYRRSRSDVNVLKISVSQIVSYMVCVAPLSTYLALPLLCDFKVEKHLLALLGVLAYLNSIVDPIAFFVVFRHMWRRPTLPVNHIALAIVRNPRTPLGT